MKTIITSLLLTLALCSCDDPQSVKLQKLSEQSTTHENFKSPETVGTLPDGRIVKCVTVERGWYDHYVYFVDGAISVNFEERSGKTSHTSTQVIIDGVPYAPVKPDID